MINVKELIEILKQYPEDLEIIQDKFSDYCFLEKEDFEIIRGVNKSGQYIMRYHITMSRENKEEEKQMIDRTQVLRGIQGGN